MLNVWLLRVMLLVYTLQKLNARKAALRKTRAIPDTEKPTWMECLVPELMSSEESEDDGSFTIRPLPWRSEKATSFLLGMDHKHQKRQSRKSLVMTFQRNEGTLPSDRPKPIDGSVPAWAVKP